MPKEETATTANSLQVKKAKSRSDRFLIIYFLFSLILTILTPSTILEYSWAQSFTDFMANQIPFVEEVGRLTDVPATQFIAAVLNLAAIMLGSLYAYNYWMYIRKDHNEKLKAMPLKKKLQFIFSVPLGLLMFGFYLFGTTGGFGQRGESIILSKYAMGILGSLLIGVAWYLISLCIAYILNFFIILISSLRKKLQ